MREIERAAAEARALAATRLSELGVPLTPATDLRYVAAVLTGGAVEPAPNLSYAGVRLAGCLERDRLTPRLLFEEYDPPVRQRFSIAHELGHFFLHHGAGAPLLCRCVHPHVDPDEEQAPGVPLIEREADAFAAAFLMPADLLRADLSHFRACASFLATRYGVSPAAMRHRLRALAALDAMEPLAATERSE